MAISPISVRLLEGETSMVDVLIEPGGRFSLSDVRFRGDLLDS